MDFALIGAAGFVAPRHLQAIHDTGHRLVAAVDPCDSVGRLDQHGYDVNFFTDFIIFFLAVLISPSCRHFLRCRVEPHPRLREGDEGALD